METLCPKCHSKASKRNGYTRHGKQNHRCLDCGKQFSLDPAEVIEVDMTADTDINENNSPIY